jgi:hypothetical protein
MNLDLGAFIRLIAYLYLGTIILQASVLMSKVRKPVVATAGVFFILACAAFSKMVRSDSMNDATAMVMTPYLLLTSFLWVRALWKISTLRAR